MRDLVLASENEHKIKEIEIFLSSFRNQIQIRGLKDFPHRPELREDADTFFENAKSKAKIAGDFTKELSLADDSGIEVDFLDGKPGVFSARYANPEGPCDDEANNKKLLAALKNVSRKKRTARYRSILVLWHPKPEKMWSFEGTCEGLIEFEPLGEGGFGYDPIFYLPKKNCTMAQISLQEKNQLSHRAMALNKLVRVLPDILRDLS